MSTITEEQLAAVLDIVDDTARPAVRTLAEALRGERATNEELRAALAQQQERADKAEAEGAALRSLLDDAADSLDADGPTPFAKHIRALAAKGDVGRSFLEERAAMMAVVVAARRAHHTCRCDEVDPCDMREAFDKFDASKEGGK
jgi:hypothetical protein